MVVIQVYIIQNLKKKKKKEGERDRKIREKGRKKKNTLAWIREKALDGGGGWDKTLLKEFANKSVKIYCC